MSGRQIEQLLDKLILFTNLIVADPARLPLMEHGHRLISLNHSPPGERNSPKCCLAFTRRLLTENSVFSSSLYVGEVVQKTELA